MKSNKTNSLINVTFVIILFLNGCATYKPHPLEPELELQRVKERRESKLDATAEQGRLNSYFPLSNTVSLKDGLSLAEANALALFYSPKILKRRSEYKISKAVLLEAGLPTNPELFLGPRISTSDSGLIFPASLAFQLPIANKLSPRKKAANQEHEKNRWLLIEKEIYILSFVQKQALKIDTHRALEFILSKQVTRSAELIAWVESLYAGGTIDSFTMQIAQRANEDAKLKLMNAQIERKRSERELLMLIGLVPDSKVEIQFPLLPLLTLKTDELQSLDVFSHPALQALEKEYQAAEHALQAEVRAQFPDIQLGPEFESDRGESSFGIGFGIQIPIFARNKTNIALAEEKRSRIRAKYQERLLGLLEKRANLSDELNALEGRLEEFTRTALREANELDQTFSNILHSTSESVLEALGAADALAHTLSQDMELKQRIGITKIDLLLASSALLPKELRKEKLPKEENNVR